MQVRVIHRSTLVAAGVALVPVLLLNVPGELVFPPPTGAWGVGGRFAAEYEHGWPWVYLHRSVDQPLSSTTPVTAAILPTLGIPALAWKSWKVWEGELWKMSPTALLANLTVGLLIIVSVAAIWEWRRGRRARAIQFTLTQCLLAVVVISAPLGWWWHAKNVAEWESKLSDSLDKWGDVEQGYHGPLWMRRLIGIPLLLPAFERVDSASIEVEGDDEFQKAINILRQFNELKELRIEKSAGATISYSSMADLKHLRYLTLENILVQEEDVADLAALRQLSEIDLTSWESQKPEVLQRLMGALPNCRFSQDRIEFPIYEGDDQPSY